MAAVIGDQQFQEMALGQNAPPQVFLVNPPQGGGNPPPQDVLVGPEGEVPEEQAMMVSHQMSLSH